MRWGALVAEWAPIVSATVTALLAGMFSGSWLNRRNVARLTSAQGGRETADAARILTDTAVSIATEANRRTAQLEARVTALEARDDAMGAHIAALMRQIERGDPPPPVAPPLPY